MKNLRRTAISHAGAVFLAAALAVGSGFPAAQAASVSDLTDAADAVVLGQALEWSVDESGTLTVLLRVVRPLFKRQLPAETVLTATFGGNRPATRRRVQAVSPFGLWFLVESSDRWTIISAKGGNRGSFDSLYYPVGAGDIGAGATPVSEEEVVLTVARAIQGADGHPWLIKEALGDYDSAAVREFLVEMTEAPDMHSQFTGLYSLLRRNDVPTLARLKEYEAAIRNDATGLGRAVPQAIELFFRDPSPKAVELLGTLANDETLLLSLREAAAHALASIHTRESLAPLARLLDAANPALQRSAAIGLSFYANGVGVHRPTDAPSMSHLNRRTPTAYTTARTAEYLGFDESRATEFIAFWKAWWLENNSLFDRRAANVPRAAADMRHYGGALRLRLRPSPER